jgi:hypothetical protein
MKVKSKFQRKSPAEFAEKTGVPVGWFVLPFPMIEEKEQRRKLHGKWCRLASEKGAVYRVIRFSPRLKSKSTTPEIVLDWVAWLELNGRDENVQDPIEISITKANPLQILFAAVHHPEPGYRIASWLALVSVGMGVVSLLMGIISLWQ